MLMIKAWHIISMVAWFAGLFYLPRLFVYHANTHDTLGIERFKIMERRLYYGIMWPAALLTTGFGISLFMKHAAYYLAESWMHAKGALVIFLWCYHLVCGHFMKQFAEDKNNHSARFYRMINEIPTVLLILIVWLVVVKP